MTGTPDQLLRNHRRSPAALRAVLTRTDADGSATSGSIPDSLSTQLATASAIGAFGSVPM